MELTSGKIICTIQDVWLDLEKDKYEAGVTDLLVNKALKDHIKNVKSWIEPRLGRKQISAVSIRRWKIVIGTFHV